MFSLCCTRSSISIEIYSRDETNPPREPSAKVYVHNNSQEPKRLSSVQKISSFDKTSQVSTTAQHIDDLHLIKKPESQKSIILNSRKRKNAVAALVHDL